MQKGGDRDDRSRKYVDSRRKYNRKYPQDIMAANSNEFNIIVNKQFCLK